jgi:hypothetical protein
VSKRASKIKVLMVNGKEAGKEKMISVITAEYLTVVNMTSIC